MGNLVSKIPALVAKSGMTEREFIGRCFAEGMSLDTAEKLYKGETNISTGTLEKVARILGVQSIGELINFSNNGDQ